MQEIVLCSTVVTTVIKTDCGRYRYILKKEWDKNKEIGAFLCANPSKADHLLFDETVFKCNNLAVKWEWGGFYVVNIFPIYQTDPRRVTLNDKSASENLRHIMTVFGQVNKIIIATGNMNTKQSNLLTKEVPTEKLFCIKKNKGGGYLHPSRINPYNFPQPQKV